MLGCPIGLQLTKQKENKMPGSVPKYESVTHEPGRKGRTAVRPFHSTTIVKEISP